MKYWNVLLNIYTLKKSPGIKKGVFRFQGLSQLGRSSVIENPVLYAIDVKHRWQWIVPREWE